MKNIVRAIDRMPFWVWPPAGAAAGTIAAGVVTVGQILIGVLTP